MRVSRWLGVLACLCAGTAHGATFEVRLEEHDFVYNGRHNGDIDLTIAVGDTVRWVWIANLHNVTSGTPGAPGPGALFTSGFPRFPPASFEHTFAEAGEFPYFCEVHAVVGMVSQVRVVAPVTILQPPADTAACAGTAVTFRVSAAGAESFQWEKNGVPIGGATGPTLTLPAVGAGDAGAYRVVVRNVVSAAEAGATLSVRTPPAISRQPVGATVDEGAAVALSVVAAGATGYQWRRGGQPLAGQTGDTLSFSTAGVGDSGSYDVVVRNDCGAATSAAVSIVVIAAPPDQPDDAPPPTQPPAVLAGPVGQDVCAGDPATFSVAATGASAYEWRKDGVALPGATGPVLSLPVVSATHAGSYNVLVSNAAGEAASPPAELRVGAAPAIVTQPQAQTVMPGGRLALAVAATDAIAFQWRRNGAEIAGATSAEFAVATASAADAGSYDVVVANACGSVTSAAAAVALAAPPEPDASLDEPGAGGAAPGPAHGEETGHEGHLHPDGGLPCCAMPLAALSIVGLGVLGSRRRSAMGSSSAGSACSRRDLP